MPPPGRLPLSPVTAASASLAQPPPSAPAATKSCCGSWVPGVEITARACPLFVPLVEAGYVDHSEAGKQQITKLVIAQYLTEVREAGVDTLILGCTHYPLLKA